MSKKKIKRVVLNSICSSSDSDIAEDLDEELLKLSKRRKIDNGDKNNKIRKFDKSSHENSKANVSDSETSESDDDWSTSKKHKNKKFKNSHKLNKSALKPKKERNSEPEEGEVTDSSSSEAQDGNSSLGEFDDGYDENLMGDEEDQARLAKMTEKERELEIFNRIEQREVLKTRYEIEKKLRQARKEDLKRRAKLEEIRQKTEASSRCKERRKLVEEKKQDKKAQAIKDLCAEREKKKKLAEQKQEKEEEQKKEQQKTLETQPFKLKACDVYSEDDSVSDSEHEKFNTISHFSHHFEEEQPMENKPRYIASKVDLNKIRLTRYLLEKWVHSPFFNKTVIGSFIRVGIGNNNGVPIYRVAEVVDIVETPKVYQLGSTRTNKGLKIKHGLQERVFRLEFVSNQEITDLEYFKWKETMQLDGLPLPSREAIEEKYKDIQNAENYQYKDNDIEIILKEKEKFQKGFFNYAMKKTELLKEKALAELARNREEVGKINSKLEKLEERAREIDKLRTSNISAISYINERNRQKNILVAEMAILEEAKLNRDKEDDPFTRRRCTPTLVTKAHAPTITELKQINEAKAEGLIETKPEEKNEATSNLVSNMKNGHTDCEKPKSNNAASVSNDLFSAHDFDIKLDLDISPFGNGITAAKPTLNKEPQPKRSLNLEQYKKMRGLI